MSPRSTLAAALLACGAVLTRGADAQHRYCTLRTVDAAGAPVAGVGLRTTNQIVLTTDRRGVAAFYEPGLMGRDVWFTVERAGYQHPAVFGLVGRRVTVAEGGTATFTLTRTSAPDPGPPPGLGDVDSRLVARPVPEAAERFRLRVVDEATGRGVPMAEVRWPGGVEYTDSAGLLAFFDLDRMGQPLRFEVGSQGYAPATPMELRTTPGAEATVRLRRTNIAERLYRITGAGIYRDSALLGLPAPTARPLLVGGVTGQDSTLTTLYRGRVFWIWGDTNRPELPLGNFWASGATSELPARGGLDPSRGVDFTYFVGADGFSRGMVPRDERGPVWLGGLVTVPDARGEERLFAVYGVYPRLADPVESGLVRFDDASATFARVHTDDATARAHPSGNALRVTFGGADYVLWDELVRAPATAEAVPDPARWEVFTPHRPDGSLDRAPDGSLRYAWRRAAPALAEMRPTDVPASQWLRRTMAEPEGTTEVTPHGDGHTAFNPHRGRYVRFVNGVGGGGFLGDIWYAESDSALGPWVYTRRVVTHARYSMYNPRQHPFFAERNGRVVYFEGTYTKSFSDAPTATPRYDYNQQMFRVDLDDPRMALPVPVYDLRDEGGAQVLATRAGLRRRFSAPRARFQAPDRPAPATVPFRWTGACADRSLRAGDGVGAPAFYGVPREATAPPSRTVPLYEYVAAAGGRFYAVADADVPAGARRGSVVARVWPHPVAVRVPVEDELPDLLADAGDDRCVPAGDGGATPVTLDGTRSQAASGRAVVRYAWRAGDRRVEGARATLALPPGLHAVTLTVTDSAGATHDDEVLVEVRGEGASPAADASVDVDAGPGASPGEEPSCGCRAGAFPPRDAVAVLTVVAALLQRRRGRCARGEVSWAKGR